MACTNKAELLALTETDYAKLKKLIAPLEGAQANLSADGTSTKDVIGLRSHWIDLFLGRYANSLVGEKVFFSTKRCKSRDLERIHSDVRRRQGHLDWAAACALLQERHDLLIQYISDRSDAELAAGPMCSADNNWTPERWAEAAGSSHYRSAAEVIRSVLGDHE